MTTKELEAVFEEQVQRCREVLLQKGKEYTPDETDRFSSFKTAAVLQHTTQANALLGMLSKHIVSLFDMGYVGTERYDMAVWNEKITDALNYLFILAAIMKEEKQSET